MNDANKKAADVILNEIAINELLEENKDLKAQLADVRKAYADVKKELERVNSVAERMERELDRCDLVEDDD